MLPATTPTDLGSWRWAFAALFIVVTVLTHLPRVSPLGAEHIPPDKLMHFAAFGLMTLLLERSRWMPSMLAFVCMVLWVPLDEWTQGLVSAHRESELADVIGGWLGVMSAGCLILAIRTPGATAIRRPWTLYISTFDRLIGKSNAGLRSTAVSGALAVAMLTAVYMASYMAELNHAGTLSMAIAMLTGAALWCELFRRAWKRNAAVKLPRVGLVWWVLALALAVPAFMFGAAWGEYGVPSLGAPSAFFIMAISLSVGIRRALYWACANAPADEPTDG